VPGHNETAGTSLPNRFVQFVTQQAAWYERTGVIGPDGPEQRSRLPVNEDHDLIAILRPFEVLTEPRT
jgi:hypothetical protein